MGFYRVVIASWGNIQCSRRKNPDYHFSKSHENGYNVNIVTQSKKESYVHKISNLLYLSGKPRVRPQTGQSHPSIIGSVPVATSCVLRWDITK